MNDWMCPHVHEPTERERHRVVLKEAIGAIAGMPTHATARECVQIAVNAMLDCGYILRPDGGPHPFNVIPEYVPSRFSDAAPDRIDYHNWIRGENNGERGAS